MQAVAASIPSIVLLIPAETRISQGVAFGASPDPLRMGHARLSCFPGRTDLCSGLSYAQKQETSSQLAGAKV